MARERLPPDMQQVLRDLQLAGIRIDDPAPVRLSEEQQRRRKAENLGWNVDATQGELWGDFEQRALPQIAFGFAPVLGQGFGRLMQLAPRATSGVAAAGGSMFASSQAGSQRQQEPSDAVRQLQIQLRDAGYYKGPVDGLMGGQTEAANKLFQETMQARERSANERARTEAETARAQAEGERARAQAAETERARQEEIRRAQERVAGEERLQMMQGEESWWDTYGPYASVPFGFAAGYFGRGALGKQMARISQNRAARADALMQPGQRGGVPGRIGRTNQFYAEGQRGSQAPFSFDPGRRPYPWQSNPNAPATEALYQPGALSRFGPGAAVAGAGGLEWGASEIFAVEPARRELTAANEAVSGDPSEANVQRLQAAKSALASAQALANFGRAAMLGVIPAEAKAQLRYAPARPNVSAAEGERGALDRLLSRPSQLAKRPKGRKR